MIKKIRMTDERLPVLIGRKGSVKKELQKKTQTNITVGEEITIDGEAINVLTAENVIKAISRGFSPENAFLLLDEENTLDIIELPKNDRALRRIRSRLIGTRGKSRRNLELLTKTKISIYGRTVGIIGKYENAELVADAIRKLMKGFSHKSVYKFLETTGRAKLVGVTEHQNEIKNEIQNETENE